MGHPTAQASTPSSFPRTRDPGQGRGAGTSPRVIDPHRRTRERRYPEVRGASLVVPAKAGIQRCGAKRAGPLALSPSKGPPPPSFPRRPGIQRAPGGAPPLQARTANPFALSLSNPVTEGTRRGPPRYRYSRSRPPRTPRPAEAGRSPTSSYEDRTTRQGSPQRPQ